MLSAIAEHCDLTKNGDHDPSRWDRARLDIITHIPTTTIELDKEAIVSLLSETDIRYTESRLVLNHISFTGTGLTGIATYADAVQLELRQVT